jgi:hypothetical protein
MSNYKTLHAFAFALFICACSALSAANVQAREPLPKINNSDDFLEFIERGILCKDQWAAANIFKGFGPNIYKSTLLSGRLNDRHAQILS